MSRVRERINELQGISLNTLHRSKPFKIVAVESKTVKVLPENGGGTSRTILLNRIEAVAQLNLSRDELLHGVLQKFPDSRNASYIAAIVHVISARSD